uniref:Phosphatase tensin-type domain-containing protein n=1 Tax=Anolis carolinensis TaxID=28377 RepID=A0A803TCN1_ANOCA
TLWLWSRLPKGSPSPVQYAMNTLVFWHYTKDGFDLDLTYVTARIIAISFPSSGQQAFYRNPIKAVAKFLDIKHEGYYKGYNLCSEQGYDPKYFHYRVERMFIDDHNVSTLEDMLKFTSSVRKWMQQDENNVIVSLGRTGTMICIWLIDSNQFDSAKDSLNYFGERRTDTSTSSKFQGIETPSQSRYVGYYATLKFVYNLNLPPRITGRCLTPISQNSIAPPCA